MNISNSYRAIATGSGVRFVAFVVTSLWYGLAQASAQSPGPVPFESAGSLEPARENERDIEIVIDGTANESIWERATMMPGFRVIAPDTIAATAHRTSLAVIYSEDAIYIAVELEQPANTLVERFSIRDEQDMARDSIKLAFDPSGNGRYGYWMSLALGDSQSDGTIRPEREFSNEWDGAWRGATALTESGWSAEFRIPWSQMSMPFGGQSRQIGLYVEREVAYRGETWAWPALPASQPTFMSVLQPLTLVDVAPRGAWSLIPFVSTRMDRVDSEGNFSAGTDLFWRPSTNFQLSATLNPDFGTIESDDVTVNLTADETLFPEKRLFFEEGQEIFNTTSRSSFQSFQPMLLVNTRRIGARPDTPDLPPGSSLTERQSLQLADLYGAAKLTGQSGRFRLGALAAFEQDTEYQAHDSVVTQAGRTFTAFRGLYENTQDGVYRGLGYISTLVAHPTGDAIVHGIDGHLLSSEGKVSVDTQLIISDVDELDTGVGAYADIIYTPRQGLKHWISVTAFDESLDFNAFGFHWRNNYREIWYNLEWQKSGLRRLRSILISPFIRYQENGSGFATDKELSSFFVFELNNLASANLEVGYRPRHVDDRNSFGNGSFIVAGQPFFRAQYKSNAARALSWFASGWVAGEDLGGTGIGGTAGATWQPTQNLSMQMSLTHEQKDGWLLHQGTNEFATFRAKQWLPEFSVDYFISAKQQFRLASQWVGLQASAQNAYRLLRDNDDLTPTAGDPERSNDFSLSQLNFQLRYRWQIAPLSDLFIVYTRADFRQPLLTGFSDLFRDSWSTPLEDQISIKLRYRIGS